MHYSVYHRARSLTNQSGDKIVSNPVERQIAHLGCSMHKMPKSRKLTHSAFNPSIARSLGYTDARITQSQLIANLAGIGREIVLHQDGSVSFTNHPSALTFWYALEQTRLENECLIVARGSHLTTALGQRVIKNDGGLPKFVNINIWSFYCCSGVDTYFIRTSPFPLEYQTWQVGKGCKFR